MQQCVDIELFGILRRLPEINFPSKKDFSVEERLKSIYFSNIFTEHIRPRIEASIPVGNLVVSEPKEPVHNEIVQSLFEAVGERLEITPSQFLWGCIADRNRLNGSGHAVTEHVGYVRVSGLWMLSGHIEGGCLHFDADSDPQSYMLLPGVRILSAALQPARMCVMT